MLQHWRVGLPVCFYSMISVLKGSIIVRVSSSKYVVESRTRAIPAMFIKDRTDYDSLDDGRPVARNL